MRQQHAAPVLERLSTHGDPDLTVFDGHVRDGAEPPYVVVYFTFRTLTAGERLDASDLTMASRAFQVDAEVHSVGGGDDPDLAARSLRAVGSRVSAALLDWTPTVAGRNCSPMRHVDDFSSAPNEQTGQTYHETADVYRFTSYPA